jgi:hypothetical protein
VAALHTAKRRYSHTASKVHFPFEAEPKAVFTFVLLDGYSVLSTRGGGGGGGAQVVLLSCRTHIIAVYYLYYNKYYLVQKN